MIIEHTVKQGDCLDSIAAQYGTTTQRIWDHADNASLRQLRKDPNVLHVGDVVKVPREPRQETVKSGRTHQFRLVGQATILSVQLLDALREPLKNQPYLLRIEGENRYGTTDDEGRINEAIPATVTLARLFVGEGQIPFEFELGAVDPISELSGVQARLNNLGFDAGPEDGILGPKTEHALEAFQISAGIEPSGKLDDDTRDALFKAHNEQ
jgi:hypothetical protein